MTVSTSERFEVVPSPTGGFALDIEMKSVFPWAFYREDPGTDLFSPTVSPNDIGRYAVRYPLSEQDSNVRDNLTTAVLDLAENYGIQSPGIGSMIPVRRKDDPNIFETWITAQRVEGLNMSERMANIPASIVEAAIESIVRYYEDASLDTTDKLYLTDISLRQLKYGTIADGTDLQTILIDIDPRLGNMQTIRSNILQGEVVLGHGLDVLNGEISSFRRIFGEELDPTIKERFSTAYARICDERLKQFRASDLIK